MMDYASPEDSVVVGDKLALIQVEFEALQRHAIERKKILDDGYKQVRMLLVHTLQKFNNNRDPSSGELPLQTVNPRTT